MNKICIIAVWIGPLPSYFPLWMRSLSKNTFFDFLLFTDQNVECDTPENLKIIDLTLGKLENLIHKKTSVRPRFKYTYKIVDFKPVYGEIFRDYIEGYKFWGYCDLDLLLGDLKKFITEEILTSNKKIFARGHLSLYRNEPSVNSAYRSSRRLDYKEILESPEIYLFDEWQGIYRIFQELNISQYQKEVMADIKVYNTRLVCYNIENFNCQIFVWEEGKVMQYYLNNGNLESRELVYVHFQKRKIITSDSKVYESPSVILNSFCFIPHYGKITGDTVRKYDNVNYKHYLNAQFKRIKNKIPFLKKKFIYKPLRHKW
jgi:hypothetical protein